MKKGPGFKPGPLSGGCRLYNLILGGSQRFLRTGLGEKVTVNLGMGNGYFLVLSW